MQRGHVHHQAQRWPFDGGWGSDDGSPRAGGFRLSGELADFAREVVPLAEELRRRSGG
jgi:hypothetical protein